MMRMLRCVRASAVMAVSAVLLLVSAGRSADTITNKWVALNGCRFAPEEHRDGDSFHIKYGQREFIMRLYFVDTPETDDSFPDRNK